MQQVRPDSTYEEKLVQGGVYGSYSTNVLTEVHLENGWLIAVYAAVGVVLMVLAWLMYRRRRSESAGDVVEMCIRDRLRVMLNEYYLPRISINGYYSDLARESDDPEARTYLKEKLRQTKWLLEMCIRDRSCT